MVEGRNDSYVYGNVCRSLGLPPFTYRLIRSDELPTPGSGKQHLLTYFMALRRSGDLFVDFKGHKAAIVFILDKDIDDWRRCKKRSKHLIYTKSYDVENYIYEHGDLIEAVSAACAEDPSRVEQHFIAPELWHELAADRWRDWIKLCLFASLLKVRGVCNYRSGSQINDGFSGKVDKGKLEAKIAELRKLSGLTEEVFDATFLRISRRVDRLFATRRHGEVFKGKWYTLQLQSEVNSTPISAGKISALGERLLTHMMHSISFDGSWVEHLAAPLRSLLVEVEGGDEIVE